MINDYSYYVIKYGKKYYSPYITSIYEDISNDINLILTDKKYLAVRFNDKNIAKECLEMDCSMRTDPDFDKSKARIVKIIRKASRS